jgi:VanZ family protein
MPGPLSIRRAWFALLVAYLALIFFASSQPYLNAPGPEFDFKDKLIHAAEYAVLGWIASMAMRPRRAVGRFVGVLFVVAIGATIAAADELYQGTVPGRLTDTGDWIADVAGLLLGATVAQRRGTPHGDARTVKR